MPATPRLSLWTAGPTKITEPDEWCYTKDGWRRTDFIAELIRDAAEKTGIDTEQYEWYFQLSAPIKRGMVTTQQAKEIINSVEGFFVRQ
jgi:hypothetical protein